MEVFANIAKHMLKGIMYHKQFEDYFRFLGLNDFAVQQRKRFLDESNAYADFCKTYLLVEDKLLAHEAPEYESIIPESWYAHKRTDVDTNTRRNAVRTAMKKWVSWEEETFKLYCDTVTPMRDEQKEHWVGIFAHMIEDVFHELQCAREMSLELDVSDYSISGIRSVGREHNKERT